MKSSTLIRVLAIALTGVVFSLMFLPQQAYGENAPELEERALH